jgi:hypothetical protein
MFEDLISRPFRPNFDSAIFAGMDGTCIFNSKYKQWDPGDNNVNPLCFEDCTNYNPDPYRIHKYPDVCKYFVGESDCTFHRV